MKQQYQQLADIIEKSDNIVFFTGAGVSVASGIPDFRSMGGLFDEISKEFFYTKSHLIRIFKEKYGITPYDYLLERKTNLAKFLLLNTVLSIGEIAAKLGFANSHYFSNFFSKRVGKSPSKYRNH